jgi:hypothetical protein
MRSTFLSGSVIATVIAGCDPQVDGAFSGDPKVELSGTLVGFAVGDELDGAMVRWNTQQGTDLTLGPTISAPLGAAELNSVVVDILEDPDPAVAFDAGDGTMISEGHLALVERGTIMARASDTVLVYVDRDVGASSLAAMYLGGPALHGYHLCAMRPTFDVPPSQQRFVDACGGTPACESQRRYQLDPADGDLGTHVPFIRSTR